MEGVGGLLSWVKPVVPRIAHDRDYLSRPRPLRDSTLRVQRNRTKGYLPLRLQSKSTVFRLPDSYGNDQDQKVGYKIEF